jgi:hypothetical protein
MIEKSFDLVAQPVEHLTFNQVAAGSNPAGVTNKNGIETNSIPFLFDLDWTFRHGVYVPKWVSEIPYWFYDFRDYPVNTGFINAHKPS